MGWLDHDRLGLQLPPHRHRLRARARPARAPRRHARRPRARGRLATARRWPASRGSSCRARTPAATRAAGSCSSSSCRAGVDRDDDDPRAARARRAVQALPAGDPPDVLLPRALRPPRGRVPGLRGRRRALDRAAVLPGDDRGAGRAGRRGAGGGGRARVHNRGPWRALRADAAARAPPPRRRAGRRACGVRRRPWRCPSRARGTASIADIAQRVSTASASQYRRSRGWCAVRSRMALRPARASSPRGASSDWRDRDRPLPPLRHAARWLGRGRITLVPARASPLADRRSAQDRRLALERRA